MKDLFEIEMTGVSVGYSHKPILQDISLQVAAGEMVGLIGPNGSGKSTIIRTLSGILASQTGQISIQGSEIKTMPRQLLARKIGVVPQIPLLPNSFTGFEVVLMGRNPHLGFFQNETKHELDIAWEAMEKTNTGHLAKRHIGELSGGEIQSLVIARVIAQQTTIVLMDEPTANLDVGRQVEIMRLMKSLCREEKLTVLAALHDLNLASQFCDRLILLNKGRVQAQGKPSQVITAENIREVYGAENCVFTHPVNGLPAVLINGSGNSEIKK